MISLDYRSHVAAVRAKELVHAAVAVIDVLRATTTITAAIAAGCSCVVPCRTVVQARREAAGRRRRGEAVLLAGERGGVKVSGFDAGNSPMEVGQVKGMTVVLTTSNGTRALEAAAAGRLVLAVCLNNLAAASRRLLAAQAERVVIVSAGEGTGPAEEDDLTAGLLIRQLMRACTAAGRRGPALSEEARRIAAATAHARAGNIEKLLRQTPHGRDLLKLGFTRDIQAAARVSRTQWVGELRQGVIWPAR